MLTKSEPAIVIIAVLQPDSVLRVYRHSQLGDIVHGGDREYLSDLLEDIAGRLRANGEDLFAQMCQLNVGPLITERAGLDLASDDVLTRLLQSFIEI